ncbi:MAG: HEAT repeat domain-containing protein, partial [Planctomycetes bacterium]|nr:HEAT repeat domain-containing protein [Planctomycetota bacterium]
MRHFLTVPALVTLCLSLPVPRLVGQDLPGEHLPAPDVRVFLAALSDPDRGVRFAAAQALGKCVDPDTLPALARAMSDPEWCVRAQAARSIRGSGPGSVSLLADALGSSDPATRLVAANGLARMGGAGRPALSRALEDGNERVRYIAARTLADASTVPTLRGLLTATDPVIGIEAAGILIDLGEGGAAVPTLLAGLREYRGVSRVRVAELLGRAGACGPGEAEAIVEILLATKEDDYRTRTALGELLVGIGSSAVEAVKAGIRRAEDDPRRTWFEGILSRIESPRPPARDPVPTDEAVTNQVLLDRLVDPGEAPHARKFAAQLLSLDPTAREALLGLLGDPIASESALGALIAMEGGLPATGEEALALAASPAPAARRLGIRGLRALGRPDALRARPDDPDEAVRAAVRWALSPPPPEQRPEVAPRPPVSALVERLADPDLSVSLAAADALPLHGGSAALPLAVKMATGHYGVLHYAEWIFVQLGARGAPATSVLVALLGHEDVNVREVAARCLGEIGPGARAGAPVLLEALRDVRISVRGRAAVALGRVGEAAAPALMDATGDPDARVRAGAIFALGWIRGQENGLRQVATDIRLPVAEPGPAAETGLVPTPGQVERARAFAGARGREEAAEVLADLPEEEAVAVLRAGLRLSDVRVAVACAAGLAMEDLDAWEAERCVELLLPEVSRPDPPVGFGEVYEYLGSAEVAATLSYLVLSDISDDDRGFVLGNCHRIVRWDLLPEIYRIEAFEDAWAVPDRGDVWMPREWSDRYRDLEATSIPASGAPGVEEGEGLPSPLRRVLGRGLPFPHFVRAWLNDSVPGEGDAPLLLDLGRQARDEDAAREDLTALLRA